MQFKAGTPVLRPGGQKVNLVIVILQEHCLQGGQDIDAVILVRDPVKVGSPHGREAVAGISLGGTGRHQFCGLIGQPEVRGLDAVLAPAAVMAMQAGMVSGTRRLNPGPPDPVNPEGEDRVKFRVFGISFVGE